MKDWNFSTLAREIWGEKDDYSEIARGKERISYVFSLFPELLKSKGTYADLRGEIKRLLSPCRDCLVDLIPEEVPYHGDIGEREIRDGELITLDCTVRLESLWVDMARTWPVGRVDGERRTLMDESEKVFFTALGLSRPGMSFRRVVEEIDRYLEDSPCELVKNCGGHGIGRDIHQGCDYIYSDHNTTLKMPDRGAYTVEPVISLRVGETLLYAYFEDTIICDF